MLPRPKKQSVQPSVVRSSPPPASTPPTQTSTAANKTLSQSAAAARGRAGAKGGRRAEKVAPVRLPPPPPPLPHRLASAAQGASTTIRPKTGSNAIVEECDPFADASMQLEAQRVSHSSGCPRLCLYLTLTQKPVAHLLQTVEGNSGSSICAPPMRCSAMRGA